jgi:NodT family efflux transporter outer membrane factor (OMF) lipoprotein
MLRSLKISLALAAMSGLLFLSSGCTSLRDYVHQGFKVGPDYCPPNAPVAEHWIDQADIHVSDDPNTICHWWTVFNDPKLNELVYCASRQNLTLREAGCRILQARATRNITVGNIFPQQQGARGSYIRNVAAVGARSSEGFGIDRYSDSWNTGFNLSWELDFWGKFRRAIASADANLDASVYDYDFVLVTLLGDVANNYVIIRTTNERIKLLQANAELQKEVLDFINKRKEAGYKQTQLDSDQTLSILRSTEAGIPLLQIAKRQAENALCVLLGMPTVDLKEMLGDGPIPTSPPDVAIGIPAELLRRRPDVRRAERLAAAQAEQIGIAQSDLYPAFSISGNLGYAAQNFPDLFRYTALNGNVGPSFNWSILNYGRIVNNVRLQDARFQELVIVYQNAVLTANSEVEDGLVTFLRSQNRSKLLDEAVAANVEAVRLALNQYKEGGIPGQPGSGDFNRYATIEQNLVNQQDASAQARGQIAQGLIQVYQALGGGWEIRLNEESETTEPVESPETIETPPSAEVPPAPGTVPMPKPDVRENMDEPKPNEEQKPEATDKPEEPKSEDANKQDEPKPKVSDKQEVPKVKPLPTLP